MANDNFNSIKVQLELTTSDGVEVKRIAFQFHKGTIRTGIFEPESCHIRYFNSIKVQLELMYLALKTLIPLFQFHKGTIRTLY